MIETIGFVLTGIGLAASIIYYANILNNANRTRELQLEAQNQAEATRQAQLYMRVWEKWDSEEFLKNLMKIYTFQYENFEEYMEKYGPYSDQEAWLSYCIIETFFEGVGVLVKRGFLDVGIIDDFLSGDFEMYWNETEIIREGLRRELTPTWAEYSEYLYDKVINIRKEQHPELFQ